MPPATSKSSVRMQFFDLLFGDSEGWICLATTEAQAPKATFNQKFYEWPSDNLKVENYILKHESTRNLYFCVNLLSKPVRSKENCLASNFLWADLDLVSPDTGELKFKIPPGIVVRSSPGKYQAYWRLTTYLPPFQAEDYAKRIAYFTGADKSGWDLTQLMRIPFTRNFKYDSRPMIVLEKALEVQAPPLLFEALPVVTQEGDSTTTLTGEPLPQTDELPNSDYVIYKYAMNLRGTQFAAVFSQEPAAEDDWSKIVWKLIHICLEAGMTSEETLSVASKAPCNKYSRDGRPIEHLWRDILKAKAAQDNINLITNNFAPLTMPFLVNEPASETFIDQYRAWATEATDAIPDFHDLSAFILLSAIVSNSVRLETSFGNIVPNIWGLILGDSTLSRKTTATRMIIDMLQTMDSNMIIATEGTAEGLLSALAERPNKASMFYKDEISGFFNAINRKDYLAGMPETLTALYDVPPTFSRRLRKETIHIESPAFVFYGAGVKERVYDSVTEEYVLSGFLPRFLVVSGETQFEKLKRIGPPGESSIKKRTGIFSKLSDIYEQYASQVMTTLGDVKVPMNPRVAAVLTDEAWNLYGDFEEKMLTVAHDSASSDLALPTFERLSRSLLKMAIILGAERQTPTLVENTITITEDDVTNAAWYVQNWGRYSIELMTNSGKRMGEKILEKILAVIQKNPGIMRSTITRHYKLNKREADEVLITLEDRMLVRREQYGKANRFWPA